MHHKPFGLVISIWFRVQEAYEITHCSFNFIITGTFNVIFKSYCAVVVVSSLWYYTQHLRDNFNFFPSINLRVTRKLLCGVPPIMKLIPYFQCVTTMSFLMVVWYNILKASPQLILSHVLYDLSSQHDKNK